MEQSQAQTFIDALHRLEEENDHDALVALFAEDATLQNATMAPDAGHDARQFWSAYRSAFNEIHSEFRNVNTNGDVVFLEWISRGTSADGAPLEYEGVSVVEFADGRITRFRAYFDPADLKVRAPS